MGTALFFYTCIIIFMVMARILILLNNTAPYSFIEKVGFTFALIIPLVVIALLLYWIVRRTNRDDTRTR